MKHVTENMVSKSNSLHRQIIDASGACVDFRSLAPFRNQNASNTTGGRKSMSNFSLFIPPVKISGGMSEISEWILRVQHRALWRRLYHTCV